MKLWKQGLIALGISALALPVAAFAADSTPPAASINANKAIRESAGIGVHKEMYYTLLSEKYTPADTEQWKAAFAERDRLLEELKALKPTLEQKAAIKENRSGELGRLLQERKAGTLDKEALQAKIQELKDGWQGLKALKTEEWDSALTARKELQKSFTEAVESGDAAAIGAALPKLLAQTQQENAALAELTAKLQAGLQKAAPAPSPSAAQQ